MPIVKALRYGQVTIPKKFREELNIKEGDLLEAELEGDKIVLSPKTLVDKDVDKDKEKAWERVFNALDRVHERIKRKGITVEEAEKDALELIRQFREEEYAKNKKSSESRHPKKIN